VCTHIFCFSLAVFKSVFLCFCVCMTICVHMSMCLLCLHFILMCVCVFVRVPVWVSVCLGHKMSSDRTHTDTQSSTHGYTDEHRHMFRCVQACRRTWTAIGTDGHRHTWAQTDTLTQKGIEADLWEDNRPRHTWTETYNQADTITYTYWHDPHIRSQAHTHARMRAHTHTH
jgi:hypothetical protein